jgi:Di-sulfide bridge nucleocytoplasmic transport domain
MESDRSPLPMDIPLKISWSEDSAERRGSGEKSSVGRLFPFSFSSQKFSNPNKKRKIKRDLPVPELPAAEVISVEDGRGIVACKEKRSIAQVVLSLNLLVSSLVYLVLNLFAATVIIAAVTKFMLSLRGDIITKTGTRIEGMQMEIDRCRREYEVNRCRPEERVPAMEEKCREWEVCMRRDPRRTEMTAVIFKVASESLEEFLSGVSLRSILIGLLFIIVLLRCRQP